MRRVAKVVGSEVGVGATEVEEEVGGSGLRELSRAAMAAAAD